MRPPLMGSTSEQIVWCTSPRQGLARYSCSTVGICVSASNVRCHYPTIGPARLVQRRHREVEEAEEHLDGLQGEIRSGNDSITPADLVAADSAITFARLRVEAAENAVRRAKAAAEKSDEPAQALLGDIQKIVKMPVSIVSKLPTGEPESGGVPQAYLLPGSMKIGSSLVEPFLEGTLKLAYLRPELDSTPSGSKIAERLGAAGQPVTLRDATTTTLTPELEFDVFNIRVQHGYAPIPRGSGHAPAFLDTFGKNVGTAVETRRTPTPPTYLRSALSRGRAGLGRTVPMTRASARW